MAKVARLGGVFLAALALVGCTSENQFPPNLSTPSPVEVSLTLYHCGINPITYQGLTWEAEEPPLDATNKPASWQGHGTLTEVNPTRLLYRDESGVEVAFLPDAEVAPRICR